ncbi:MAG TPA: TerB family tellurite resistance protein [Woeseiaceae bacterium]|nr:TerB family tellurite resistance protein [Woeseiaceae bacterium]
MIKRIIEQIAGSLSQTDTAEVQVDRDSAIRKATAVLMLDVALADKEFSLAELERLEALAESHFGLGQEEAADLVEEARNEAEHLVSLHEFTHLLHNHLSEEEKASIVGMLWQIAYTDGHLDKYENSLVLKISDLLYVSRGRVMRLKHDAKVALLG